MLSLALACGGLAASEVGGRVRDAERMVGAPTPVLVATRDLPAQRQLRRSDVTLREVPSRYVPPGALSSPARLAGARTAVALPAGAPLTASQLGEGDPAAGPGALRRGERAVEVAVAGGSALATAAGPGARVDVLVSTEDREGPGRSFLALEDVEVLDLRPGGGAEPAASDPGEREASAPPAALATLRVTVRQAVYLTAAQNYAREVRLLPRPAGDARRTGRAAVGAGDL